MFVLDDLLLGIPFLAAVFRAAQRSAQLSGSVALEPVFSGDVHSCRASVPIEPGLKHTSALLGGYFYNGHDAAHLAYLDNYLSQRAAGNRSVLAFQALQNREGSTAAINTYDNQLVTLGSGWGALGGLPRVMDELIKDETVNAALAACGVQYLGQGMWSVIDDAGNVVTGKKEALQVIRNTPAILNLFIHLAKDPLTRDAVTSAQLNAFLATSGNVPSSDSIATQALYNFVTHLKHWAPGYMSGTLEEALAANPGTPSVERDTALAPAIVSGFYTRAHGWIPDWKQMLGYVRDMKADGLDVTGNPLLSASSAPPSGVKAAAGCGQLDYPNSEICGNWGTFAGKYLSTEPPPIAVKVVGGPGVGKFRSHGFQHAWYRGQAPAYNGYLFEPPYAFAVSIEPNGVLSCAGVSQEDTQGIPGQVIGLDGQPIGFAGMVDNGYALVPPGFEGAYEVTVEPELDAQRTAGGPGWGETYDPEDPYRHIRRAQGPGAAPTPEQITVIKRGIVSAVQDGTVDPPAWTQISIPTASGRYDLMVMNEPLAVQGLRLPTSFLDAIAISRSIGALPITPAISDARWAQAQKVIAKPLGDPTGALMNDPGQVVRYNATIGPNTGAFVDGYWKELVLVPGLQQTGRGSMAQYGFKLTNTMYEHGEPSNHDRFYKDYSDTPTYVSRRALKDGVEVDLLDEFAAGCPLGGPLPAWLVNELRGDVS